MMVNVDTDQVIGLNLLNIEITKIMVYKFAWLKKYYWDALQEVFETQQQVIDVQPALTYQPNIYYNCDDENSCCIPYMLVFYCAIFLGVFSV